MSQNTDLRHPFRQRKKFTNWLGISKSILQYTLSIYILRRSIKQTCRFESFSIMKEDPLKHSEAGVLHLRP
jgi:hypothetical protein